jgi:carbon monoxide dehydrogenase subunit G
MKMRLAINFTEKLSAPRKSVFREITGYDDLQDKFPNVFLSIRVLERSKSYVVTEESFSVMGTIVTQRSKHKVRTPTIHEVEILSGDLRGSSIVERYSDSGEGGTIVRVDADFMLGGFLSLLPSFVIRPLIEGNVRRVFTELEEVLGPGSTP